MTDQYLLIVSDKDCGFTVNSICNAVKRAGIEVKTIAITDVNLLEMVDEAFGVLIADTYENPLIMNAIKNKCYETNKKVILYGSPEELSTMKRVFIDSVIYKEYVRPVELEEVVLGVKKLIVKMENQNVMKKILVVDDNGVFLRTAMEWLEGKYIVSVANSAKSAIGVIRNGVPDLILLDYEMPLCSGAQFMEMLAGYETTKDIPIIFLTSRCDEETVKEVMQLKPKGYILKTTTQDQILKKIEDFFDSVMPGISS